MKKVKTEDAVGLTLCHDITEVRDGFKGRAFQRGHVITEADVPHLLNLGKKHIYIWEDSAGEIHEEDAALRLAAMALVEGAVYTGPSEGKMTLTAELDGLFRVNRPAAGCHQPDRRDHHHHPAGPLSGESGNEAGRGPHRPPDLSGK